MKSILLAALVLSGCGMLQPSVTPDQIKASQTKDVNAVCITGSGPWGKAQTTYLNVDKSVIKSGNISVDDQCKITFTNADAVK